MIETLKADDGTFWLICGVLFGLLIAYLIKHSDK